MRKQDLIIDNNFIYISVIFLLIISTIETLKTLETKDIAFVIQSQSNKYHADKALLLKDSIKKQSKFKAIPTVYITKPDFQDKGDWTFFPLIPILSKIHSADNVSMVFFLQDSTFVNLDKLLEVLAPYKDTESFIGYPFYDEESTIIHHYAFHEDPEHFKYPCLSCGFAITTPLLKKIASRMAKEEIKKEFNIDVSHELSLYIWNNGTGPRLSSEFYFCPFKKDFCATYHQPFIPCGNAVNKNSIYFAVKTHSKFHEDRVKVVKRTWARFTPIVKFFSDVEDENIPTIKLKVENTEHGHCAKTFSILRYVYRAIRNQPEIKWIALVDDDTIISPTNLAKYLSCFNPEQETIMGERYGFSAHHTFGYNYITGGGGTVMSRQFLQSFSTSNCECPTPDTPDDMYLGFCLNYLGIDLVHSPLFHQARPKDYSKDLLRSQNNIISFHKHWMVDPIEVFHQWFRPYESSKHSPKHEEL